MTDAFLPCSRLPRACAGWSAIALTGLTPRRRLDLADKRADWKEALAALGRFAASPGYARPMDMRADAALDNYHQWQEAGQQACRLLIYGLDLGLDGAVLRPIYLETVALWKDAAAVAGHARASMAQYGQDDGVAPPIATIATRGSGYPCAVILLALASLLDAQDEVPAIVEQVLAFDTDRLLDYLSAGAIELHAVNETLFHKRPYGALLPFFEQLDAALPGPLVPYLKAQYEEFHRLSPRQQKKGGPWLGTYYWALEVAALSVLYGWDDTALRASPCYPADLVDFARVRATA
ncbi:PoNe immunity protein domain-containing protein [Comamonas terrae]|uniref:PoNe immunity protein domain-containing protein n=1 Tax=Comamonas terrae TaxID=673548 RepID=A0ABW5UTX7_9BURK|nr:PoNe immunity protein domain-containing protein [Comamonas terrae]